MKPKRVVSLLVAGCMAVSMVPASAVTAFATSAIGNSSVSVENAVEVTSFTTGQLSTAIQGKCTSVGEITSLKVSGGELNADDFYYIRDNLTALESLDLSGATCVNNKIPDSALFKNRSTYNLTLKTFLFPQNVTEVGENAFNRCSVLNNFGYGEGVLQMPETITVIGNNAFAFLNGFNSINLPKNLQKAGTWSFAYCNNLKGTIVIPDTLTVIPKAMFESTENTDNYITSVVIPEGVTTIEGYAFRHRSALHEINFPSTLTEIGGSVFWNCSGLTDVKLNENLKYLGRYSFCGSGVKYIKMPSTLKYTGSIQDNGIADFTSCSGTEVAGEVNQNMIYVLSDDSNINITETTSSTLTKVYTNGGYVKTADSENRTVTPAKDGYTFEDWYENKDFTGNAVATIATGKTYYAKWTENASMDANADKKDDSQNATVTVGKPVEITVTVNPGDHMADIWTGKAKITFTDPSAVESLSCNGKTYTGEQLKEANYTLNVSDLMPSSSVAAQAASETAKMSVVFNKKGNQNITIQLLDSKDNLLCESTTAVTVEEEKKPEETKKDDDTKKDDTKPENPVTTYALTVADGTVKVNGKDVAANESGAYAVEKDAKVEVTFDKTTLSDAQVFDQWTITPASVLNAVDPKSETISFTMPAEEVSIKAMTRDATIESDGPGVLGTAAMIGVGVAGTAVLGYQGYMIGTELYLKNVMPAGAAIPTNTAELAKLVWNDAGCPEPVALLAADATDEQKALTWAVENKLISADKAADASVTRWEVIQAWNQEQEMKKV